MTSETTVTHLPTGGEESLNVPRFTVDVTKLENLTKHLRREFASIATVFLRNFEKIRCIHMMPYHVAADGVAQLFQTAKYVEAALRSPKRGPEAVQENTAAARKLFEDFLRHENSRDELALGIDHTIQQLMRRPDFREAIQMLFFVSVPLLWTAFETVVRNTWVALVNRADSRTVQRIFNFSAESESDPRTTGRGVSIGMLAKFDFDLRGKFGLVLQDKFHFSSLSGMLRAYRAVSENFPRNVFETKELKRAEQLRHLIVHNAGIIDEQHKKISGALQSIGEEVDLTDEDVSSFGCAVLLAGTATLEFANSI